MTLYGSLLSRKALGDHRSVSLVLASVLTTTLGVSAAQPTPTHRPKITQPVWLKRPLPDPAEVRRRCPKAALAAPILEAQLRADGTMGEVRLTRSSGCPAANDLLEQSARRWKFKPALQDGKPVDTWLTMVINHLAGE